MNKVRQIPGIISAAERGIKSKNQKNIFCNPNHDSG